MTRLRAVYVADTMLDVRMLEGLARHLDLVVLGSAANEHAFANFWPPRPPAQVDRILLPGGRRSFLRRAPLWLRRHRHELDVAIVLDNLTAALAANAGHLLGGPPVLLQVGRPTVDYVRVQGGWKVPVAAGLVGLNERLAGGVGAVSEYVARSSRRRCERVRFIPWYGVDTAAFRPGPTREEARRRIGLPEAGPVVMLRSRLAPEKDPHTWLDAVRLLRDEGRSFTAVYMGGELDDMRALARAAAVDVVTGKPQSVDEIPLWYVAADVDVQTSKAEGLGVSPLEALACGTPVVVSDVGGLPEVVDGGRVGELVPVGDPAALADAIARLLDDPQRATAQAAAGRAWVEERFSTDAAFEAWAELAAAVAGRRPPDVPRRVLFVDHETRLSGGERDLVDLVRALDHRQVEVHVALPGAGALAEALAGHGAHLHEIAIDERLRKVSRWDLARRPWKVLGHLRAFAAGAAGIVGLARRLRPDVIHTNSMKAHLLAAPAPRLSGAAAVWHVRDVLPAGWLRRAFAVLAAALAQRVVVLSHAAAVAFSGTPAERKVRVVHNGIRPGPVDPDDIEAWRRKLGASDGQVLVGIVGQIAHWKGQDVLLDAAARLTEARPELRFAVVGECLFPENEGSYDAELRRRVGEDPALRGRVVWAGHAEPIEPVMAALDVLVHASRLPEPFGRVIVEAMAQGTPVVTTTVGAGPELVGQAGTPVTPGDAVALAAALDRLTTDAAALEAAGEAARARARLFDIDATARGVTAVWEELGR